MYELAQLIGGVLSPFESGISYGSLRQHLSCLQHSFDLPNALLDLRDAGVVRFRLGASRAFRDSMVLQPEGLVLDPYRFYLIESGETCLGDEYLRFTLGLYDERLPHFCTQLERNSGNQVSRL